jgi:D-methionine transport system ATP-binding protein
MSTVHQFVPRPVADGTPAPAADSARTIIAFEGVSKSFPAHRGKPTVTALSDIDLAVPQGSILGVIGRSGAGKSTLIRLVNGLERPTAGRIVVDGIDLSNQSESELRQSRRSIGMIFQHFNLLSSRTVFDNIALPLEVAGTARAAIKARVEELIDLVGLTDKRDRYPAELSGGQKQRVGIARALATNPKVLLSDEATSALDPETTRSILELLAEINARLGLTILLITHEMSVVRHLAHQVAVIDEGRIVEQGEVFDIFTRPAHPVTHSFLASETGNRLPGYLASRMTQQPEPGSRTVVRIHFEGPNATDPVVARLSRELAIDVTLLAGTIDEIAGRPFGSLVVGVPGGTDTLTRALTFLTQLNLRTEVLGHVA